MELSRQFAYAYKRVFEGVNYRLRNFAGGRFASYCRPASIVLLLTEHCNARCVHCDIWKNTGREDTPDIEQWKRVLTDIREWLGPVSVCLSGGEALMKPYTVDLARHAVSIGLFVEVLTHGYWEDQSKIERLALSEPWRITLSLDGIGETHTQVRGRPKFWERTTRSIDTLKRVRTEKQLKYTIRLKNVIMSHNLCDTIEIAHFANHEGMEVFYQPIEQNYNTVEDPRWYETSQNWPKDIELAAGNVRKLIELKKAGHRIANSFAQLEAMIPYFRHPEASRVAVQGHSAHERQRSCAALTTLQINANGDVTVCTGVPRAGNIKSTAIRHIWEHRPRLWKNGCCLGARCGTEELGSIVPAASLTSLSQREPAVKP